MDNFNDSKALAIEIAKILDKKKAQDVRVLKVESLTVLTDYFVIASGTSTTQVGSLADEVEYELSQSGIEPHTTEGFDSKNWVLLDYSSVIVHVFVPNTRTYYDLEHLWADGEPIDISEYLTPQGAGSVHIVHALQLEQRHLPLRADGGDVIALAALCRSIETARLFEEIHAVAPQLQLHFAAHTVGGDDLACFQILLHKFAPVQPLSLASLDSSPIEGSLWRRDKALRNAKASPR